MAVIALTSAAGSPGVTTTAVALALSWPRSVILVDADPGAYQAVLAGYLRGEIATAKGLQRVAEAHRDRRPLAEVVSDETVPLVRGPVDVTAASGVGFDHNPGPGRRLVPGFLRPANAALFGPVWPELMATFARYEEAGIDVILDLGRMDRHGLPQPVLDQADLVVLLTRSSLRAVAAARGYAAVLREQTRLTGVEANCALMLVGEDQPYGRREIANLLNLPVAAALADDADSARVFSEGAHRSRRFERSALPRSLPKAVHDLDARIRRRRARLGLDEPAGAVTTAADAVTTLDAVAAGGESRG